VNRNLYTNEKVEEVIGMNGFWTDNLYWSTARDMARFGLLALNDFDWDGNPVLTNSEYIDALTSPSQEMNLAYGYLWWLNGQESFMVPLDPNVYNGWLVLSAPEDMYAALGANDQKIYVVPSQNMVVIRQGNEAYDGAPALSGFDIELWELISNLDCEPLITNSMDGAPEKLIYYPNPSTGMISTDISGVTSLTIYSALGKLLKTFKNPDKSISLDLAPGFYLLQIQKDAEKHFQRLLIRRD
jgi:CubicO group peptidase (beta-lactamase class C family)